jgi:Holliday junction resolvase RusA-like endonuclease
MIRNNMTAPAIAGPVSVVVTFIMPRPKKPKALFPDRKPDIEKLQRSTFDALKSAGVYEDDARIIKVVAEKVYAGDAGFGLDVPGAVIEVTGL